MLSTPKHTPWSLAPLVPLFIAAFSLCSPLFPPAPWLCYEGQLRQLSSLFGKLLHSMQVILALSDQSGGWLFWCLSQSCVSHVLLRTAHLWLWRLMWNYLLFLLSCVSADFILLFFFFAFFSVAQALCLPTNFLFLPVFHLPDNQKPLWPAFTEVKLSIRELIHSQHFAPIFN